MQCSNEGEGDEWGITGANESVYKGVEWRYEVKRM